MEPGACWALRIVAPVCVLGISLANALWRHLIEQVPEADLLAHDLNDQRPGSGSIVKVRKDDLLPRSQSHLTLYERYSE